MRTTRAVKCFFIVMGLHASLSFAQLYDFGSSSPGASLVSLSKVGMDTKGMEETITVTTRNEYGKVVYNSDDINHIKGAITGSNSMELVFDGSLEDGTYTASYTPAVAGTDALGITLNGEVIEDGSIGVADPDNLSAQESTIWVNSAQTGTPMVVYIYPYDDSGRRIGTEPNIDVKVLYETSIGTLGPISPVWDNGRYKAELAVLAVYESVTVSVDFVDKENPEKFEQVGDSINVAVTDDINAAESDVLIPAGVLGEQKIITIIARDANSHKRSLGGDSDAICVYVNGSVDCLHIKDQLDGSYTATYTPQQTGSDDVVVKIEGISVTGSPFDSPVSVISADVSTFGIFDAGAFTQNTEYASDKIDDVGFRYQSLLTALTFENISRLNTEDSVAVEVAAEFGGKSSKASAGCNVSGDENLFCEPQNISTENKLFDPISFSFIAETAGDVFLLPTFTKKEENSESTYDDVYSLSKGFGTSISEGVTTPVANPKFTSKVSAMVGDDFDGNSGTTEVLIASDSKVYRYDDSSYSTSIVEVILHTTEISVLLAADFDADDDLDLFVGSNNGPDSVYLNDGSGVFSSAGQLDNGDTSSSFAATAAHIDDTTQGLDLVVARSPESDIDVGTTIYSGNGDGTFTVLQQLPAQSVDTYPAQSVVVDDFNADGNQDVALGYAATTSALANQIYFGDGTTFDTSYPIQQSVFGSTVTTSDQLNTRKLLVGDMNDDGKNDLIALSQFSSLQASAYPVNSLLISDGMGNLSAEQQFGIDNVADALLVDVNNDGKQDVVVLTQEGLVKAYLGDGHGSLSLANTLLVAGDGGSALLAYDADGENRLLVATDSGVHKFENTDGSLFSSASLKSRPCESDDLGLNNITGCINTGKTGDSSFGGIPMIGALLMLLVGMLRRPSVKVSLLLMLPSLAFASESQDTFLSIDYTRLNYQQSGSYELDNDMVGFKYAKALPWQQTFFDAELLMAVGSEHIDAGDLQANWEVDWAYNFLLRRDFNITDSMAWYVMGGLSYVHTRTTGVGFEHLAGASGASAGLGIEGRISNSNRLFLEFIKYPDKFEGNMSSLSLGIKHRY